MNILDDLEEYTKLISNVGFGSKGDNDSKLSELKEKLENHSQNLEKLKDSHEVHKNDVDSRISQLCIDLELHKRENDSVHNTLSESSNSVKSTSEALHKEVSSLKDYIQSMEDYKKVTNERIEKLVKLFLSINK